MAFRLGTLHRKAHLMTTTTITNVRVFDGTNLLDGPFNVMFSEQGITAVTARPEGSGGADTILDGTGRTLLPGLIDAHVHLDSLDNLRAFTQWGVTTALDMGSQPRAFIDSLRSQHGVTDVRSSGSPASGPGGIQTTKNGFASSTALTGPDQAERFIDDRIAEGSDYIKIIIETPGDPVALTDETIAALVAAAHAKGFVTIAHAASTGAYRLGLDAHIDYLTHAPLDADATPDLLARVLAEEVAVIPTLTMMKGIADSVGMPSSGDGPGYRHAKATVQGMKNAGIPILAGTDANNAPFVPFSPVQGESLHGELKLLVDAGLSPVEALRSATSTTATLFRLDDRGHVQEGFRADLLLVKGDPTVDITASRNIDQVWIAGIPSS